MRPRTLAEETELARAAGDYYIPPYKLAQMTKTAAKILDILSTRALSSRRMRSAV